jgi:hypothetical protein
MTAMKATALVLGFAGAFALGVVAAPQLTDRTPTAVSSDEKLAAPAPAPVAPASRVTPATRPAVTRAPAVPASAPEIHVRMKPVLNAHTNLKWAAEGFRDAEQFATVAYAARNTGIPFAVLKHRVLEEKKSLSAAIHELRPALDAKAEARRAATMARSDVASIGLN